MIDMITYAAARRYTDIKTKGITPDPTVFKFKGIKEYIADLPLSGLTGDVWLVQEDSNEYFWDGTHWEAGGGIIDLSGKLDKYQGTENIGKNFVVGNDGMVQLIENSTKPWQFVKDNPTTDISESIIYLTPLGSIFPSVANFLDDTWHKIAVTGSEEDGYKLIRFKNDNDKGFYQASGAPADTEAVSLEYQIAELQDYTWVFGEVQEGRYWYRAMGWTGSIVGRDYDNILYANSIFSGKNGGAYSSAFDHYNPENNQTNIDGVPTDFSKLNPYKRLMQHYNGTDWEILGVCDFTDLFEEVKSEIEKKADKPIVETNITIPTNDWVVDSTYANYGYKADITIQGVTSDMIADIYFNSASAALGTLAPFCETSANTVTIYCSANDTAVTIDKVVIQ